jgi:hypothetical protein
VTNPFRPVAGISEADVREGKSSMARWERFRLARQWVNAIRESPTAQASAAELAAALREAEEAERGMTHAEQEILHRIRMHVHADLAAEQSHRR